MHFVALVAAIAATLPFAQAQEEVEAVISARTDDIESDWSAIYYGTTPLLVGNDGTAGSGGFRTWELDSATPMVEVVKQTPGRTKLVTSVYNVTGHDYLITIDAPQSILAAYDYGQLEGEKKASKKALGDWSALCPWKSQAGNQYVYLFGKKQAVQFLLRNVEGEVE